MWSREKVYEFVKANVTIPITLHKIKPASKHYKTVFLNIYKLKYDALGPCDQRKV